MGNTRFTGPPDEDFHKTPPVIGKPFLERSHYLIGVIKLDERQVAVDEQWESDRLELGSIQLPRGRHEGD